MDEVSSESSRKMQDKEETTPGDEVTTCEKVERMASIQLRHRCYGKPSS